MTTYCKEQLPKHSKKEFLRQYFLKNQPATYYTGSTMMEVNDGKSRTAEALTRLLNGSFKIKTSLEQTVILLMDLLSNKQVRCLYCDNVKNVVFYNPNNPIGYYTFIDYHQNMLIEPYKVKKENNKYSFIEMIKLYKESL